MFNECLDQFLAGFYVLVQMRDRGLYRDFKVRVLFEKARRSRAFLMHEGFVIPAKSDVEYLNWLLKPISTLKYFKSTSTLKYFKGTSTLMF